MDINLIREQPQVVKDNMTRKGAKDTSIVDEVSSLDSEWRSLKNQVDNLRAERNKVSKEINTLKKAGKDASEALARAKSIPSEIKEVEEKANSLLEKIKLILKDIPNLMHESVPQGKSDADNVEVKRFGPEPISREVKPHQILAEELGVADFDSAAKTSGSGFYYLEGELALLNQALIRYAIETMHKKGFRYVETPLLIRKDIIDFVTDLNDQDSMIYKIEGEDLYLIGTSEHSLIGRFVGQLIPAAKLPIKQTSYSMCFRKEKGSHGLDEKGLFRTHQFNKVEMVVICDPEDSMKFFNEMWGITVEIFTSLGLPTRTLQICTGDLGVLKHIQYDVEVFSPRKNDWIEVGSCSNLTTHQARGLGIRADNGKEKFTPHTLNNTAIATSRGLVTILETFQQEDGSVKIPEVLHPYMMGITEIKPQ